jgi:hypothetical protein
VQTYILNTLEWQTAVQVAPRGVACQHSCSIRPSTTRSVDRSSSINQELVAPLVSCLRRTDSKCAVYINKQTRTVRCGLDVRCCDSSQLDLECRHGDRILIAQPAFSQRGFARRHDGSGAETRSEARQQPTCETHGTQCGVHSHIFGRSRGRHFRALSERSIFFVS